MSQSALDHEKEEILLRAACMDRVPLIQLDRLIKERQQQALDGNTQAVELLNEMIRKLLSL